MEGDGIWGVNVLLTIRLGDLWGSVVKLPRGSGVEPRPKMDFIHI